MSPGESMRLCPAWNEVNELALRILTSESKDLEILAWLAEAQLRVRGFEGLRDVFAAMATLLDTYWGEIHSIGNGDDIEEKVAPLAGLNGVNSEGSLIQAIRLTPLVPGAPFARHSLWDYQLAHRASESARRAVLYEAVGEAGRAAMADHLAHVEQCRASFARMSATLTGHCGEQAPPNTNTIEVLGAVASAIRDIAGIHEDTTADDPSLANDHGAPAASVPDRTRRGEIGSREDAFSLLLSVARYFRGSEPHSPISLAIETLVRRGRMDFSELLAELLPDANARNAVLTAAGIKTGTNA